MKYANARHAAAGPRKQALVDSDALYPLQRYVHWIAHDDLET